MFRRFLPLSAVTLRCRKDADPQSHRSTAPAGRARLTHFRRAIES